MSETMYQFKVKRLENGDAEIFAFSENVIPACVSGEEHKIIVPAFEIVKMSIFGPIGQAVDPVVKPPTAKEKFRGITMEQKIAKRLQEFDRLYNKYQFEVKRLDNGSVEIYPFRETTSPDLPGTVIEVPPIYMKSGFGVDFPAVDSVVEPPSALEKLFGVTMEQKIARRLKKFDKVYNRE
ncbi:MAG: hypothetical protein AAB465_00205 [Patescibacteria group bacterium]